MVKTSIIDFSENISPDVNAVFSLNPSQYSRKEIKRKLDEKAAKGEVLTEEDQESDTNPVVTKGNLIKVLSKRPYNASLKQLVWKARDQFVKRAGKDT